MSQYKAVIFDLGGVIIGSPFGGIVKYEQEINAPPGTIQKQIIKGGLNGPWGKWERNEITYEVFCHEFAKTIKEAGHENFDTISFLAAVESSTGSIRKRLLEYIKHIRSTGIKVAVLTNNFYTNRDDSKFYSRLSTNFDVFVESRVVKLNKPDPKIYHLVLEKLQVQPHEAIFLDDLGINLKVASKIGIRTIKVTSEDQAITDLSKLLPLVSKL